MKSMYILINKRKTFKKFVYDMICIINKIFFLINKIIRL